MNVSLRKEARQAPAKTEAGHLPSVLRDMKTKYTSSEDTERKKMIDVMKERIKEDRLDLAKEAIAEGDLSTEQIARIFKLQLSEVQKLAEEVKTQSEAE